MFSMIFLLQMPGRPRRALSRAAFRGTDEERASSLNESEALSLQTPSGHTAPVWRRANADTPLISSLRVDVSWHSVFHMLVVIESPDTELQNDEGRLVSLGGLASALLENDATTA